MNIEHPMLNGKKGDPEMVKTHSPCSIECSVLDIRFSFDVGRSMLDVRRSSFKTIPYGIDVTSEGLQNNLALIPYYLAAASFSW